MVGSMAVDQSTAGSVRVRFAPSPTGFLHVGGARTALFNWLFARRHRGAFILRIEDTDAERSSWDMVTGIVEGLRWLGLDWDEGPDIGGPHAPYFQSERLDRYRAAAAQLVASGHAYACYCAPEVLKAKRAAAEQRGEGWIYDRTCLSLTRAQQAELDAAGAPRAVRFKVPPGSTRFHDLVHGDIEFDHANVEDFVVLRSDSHPTYHLSVVTDDVEMRITHVVRGDDHISNTPKQILLYGAFGAPVPAFAHVPLILGADKKRLSKRHGATSVLEYQRAGYLPEAIVNFLALLGWSPGTDQEVFTRGELIAAFSLEGISGGHAVFNPEKLDWFNRQHITRLDDDELIRRLEPLMREAGLWRDEFGADGAARAWLRRFIDLYRPRVTRPADFLAYLPAFLGAPLEYEDDAVAKHLSAADTAQQISTLRETLARTDPFDAATIERALRDTADRAGVKAGTLIHATRVAVTGKSVSPGIFDVLALLGRERTLSRLDELEHFLAARSR
jgi:glutamyl-tRNA synthetase